MLSVAAAAVTIAVTVVAAVLGVLILLLLVLLLLTVLALVLLTILIASGILRILIGHDCLRFSARAAFFLKTILVCGREIV